MSKPQHNKITKVNKILIILGVEGCGHHGLRAICFDIFLQRLKDNSGIINEVIFKRNEIISHPSLTTSNLDSNPPKVNLQKFFAKCDADIILRDCSYPYRQQRNVNMFGSLLKFYKDLSEFTEVRVLHLKRNIFNTINSHCNWDGGLLNHTKVICEFDNYLTNETSTLRSNNIKVHELNYEDIPTKKGIETISSFLSVNSEVVETSIKLVFKTSQKDFKQLLNNQQVNSMTTILNHYNIT